WPPCLSSRTHRYHRLLHSFPTRRSSDLRLLGLGEEVVALVVDHDEGGEVLDLDLPDRFHAELGVLEHLDVLDAVQRQARGGAAEDRKSTRLNSSHVKISYAVFCLKKKIS